MIRIVTTEVEQTMAAAAAISTSVTAGDLLLLSGDLGAGKTAFVKGFAAALGVTELVTSPTFTLAQRYEGRFTVHHLDVYRLERISEVVDLAIPELLDGNSVTLIEWGDAIATAIPPDYLEVGFELGEGVDDRSIECKPVGAGWLARERQLAETLSTWLVTPC